MPNSLSDSHLPRSVTTRLRPAVCLRGSPRWAEAPHRRLPWSPTISPGWAQIYATSGRVGSAGLYGRRLAGRAGEIRTVLRDRRGGREARCRRRLAPRGSATLPRAQICGIDIHAKNICEPRITIFQGSQSDRAFLTEGHRRDRADRPASSTMAVASAIIHASSSHLFLRSAWEDCVCDRDSTRAWTDRGGAGAPGIAGHRDRSSRALD